MLARTHYTADDRERFADPHAAARAKERAEHLRGVLDRIEDFKGKTIAEGQRLFEDAHYAGADFGQLGYAHELRDFRNAIEDALSGVMETVRLEILEAAE